MAEKKGFFYRLTMGKDNIADYDVSKLPGTRWQVFKDVFGMRLGALVKINLLVLLFALPTAAVIVIFNFMKSVYAQIIPYNANIGIGYPVIFDANSIGQSMITTTDMQMYLLLIPCIMFASIGLAGAFNVIKLLVWGEGVSVMSHFFLGIKNNIVQFLWSSLFVSVSFVLLMFNFSVYTSNDLNTIISTIGIVLSVIQFILVLCMMLFLTTQSVTYKLSIWALTKNSFLFAVALLPQNLFFLVVSAIPVIIVLILPGVVQSIGLMLLMIIGFSYIVLVWTVYGQYAFDKFINDKVEGAVKNKGMYKMSDEEKLAREERKRKASNIRYVNPKKRKPVASIEEGSSYTPLATNFSRADLARLATEKEQVKQEIDTEYQQQLDEYNSESEEVDEYEVINDTTTKEDLE